MTQPRNNFPSFIYFFSLCVTVLAVYILLFRLIYILLHAQHTDWTHIHPVTPRRTHTMSNITRIRFSLFIRLWLYVCVCFFKRLVTELSGENCVPVDLSSSTVSHSLLPILCVPKKSEHHVQKRMNKKRGKTTARP